MIDRLSADRRYAERDSRKDEAVVFIFIFATGGLLAWAVCKPWIEKYLEVRSTNITLGIATLPLTT